MHPDYQHIGEKDDCLIEEMSELTKELCKAKRFGIDERRIMRILEEADDVKLRLDEYLNNLLPLLKQYQER